MKTMTENHPLVSATKSYTAIFIKNVKVFKQNAKLLLFAFLVWILKSFSLIEVRETDDQSKNVV